jgi:hypothetical protein
MWTCPRCGRTFANRNQSHACGSFRSLDLHFAGKDPDVRRTFDRVLALIRKLGPVEVLPEKTRIALHVRMSFTALMPKRRWLDGHVVLARRLDSPRFKKIYVVSPRNVVHEFRLTSPTDVDEEVAAWLREAYAVGEQKHVR